MSKYKYIKIFILLFAFFLPYISKAQLQINWINKYASISDDSLASYWSCNDFTTINHFANSNNSIWSIGSFSTNEDYEYPIDFSQNLNDYGLLNSDYESCSENSAQKFIKSINPETGTLNWVRKLNIEGIIRSLVSDNNGNFYISGFIDDTTNFNFKTTYPWEDQVIIPTNFYNGFIAKYSNCFYSN